MIPPQPEVDSLSTAIQNLLENSSILDRKEAKEAAQAGDEKQAIDNTPWMRKTRWARKFGGRDLIAVATLCAKPSKDEGSLLTVWHSVHRVLEQCRSSISDWHEHEEDGDVVLGWLNSSQIDRCNSSPFSTYYEKSTHVKYVNWWAHGICYCLRLLHREDRHGHSFSAAEERALHHIWDIVELGCEDDAALDASVFDLSVLLWTHTTRAQSKSTVIHLSAVFGIDNHKGCYRLPPVYGQILAALLYCARILLFEYALPAEKRENIDDPCACFLEIHHQWLVDGRPTPFHYIDNLLAYALGAGKEVGGKPRVQWSKDRQTLIYQGQRLQLRELRGFVSELCTVAEAELFNELMFLQDSQKPYHIDLGQVVDDMNETLVGYSFISDTNNGLFNGRERMLKRLAGSPKADSFLHVKNGELEVQPRQWRQYRLRLQRFLSILFILIHTSNVPARGVEVLPIRFLNAAEAPRNIFVHDGQVMIVTAYHKSQALTGHHKVIARFLNARIGQLLVCYLAEVRPFVALIDREMIPTAARCFLWADEKGIWKTPRATKALVEESALRLKTRITIQDYRHISKAIDREHVRGLEGDIDDGDDVMHDLAAAHTPQTADAAYGVDASMLRSLSARTLRSFRTVSDRWNQFWRLGVPSPVSGKAHGRTLSANAVLPPAKRRQVLPDPKQALKVALRTLIGPDAEFRSAKQEEALLAVEEGQSPLVVVLPPGAGKSLLFQLPASLPTANTTIVVLPFRALTKDLVKRSRGLGLTSVVWTDVNQPSARIIFVGAETAAVNDDFLTYVSDMQTRGKLDRIVIDECHIPLTSGSYRLHLMHLDRLRSIPCQLILLTGTLPPLLQTRLEDVLLLGTVEHGLRYIRAGTNRPNVEYTIEVHGESELEDQLYEKMHQARSELAASERAVVFCRSRTICERIAKRLECQLYHRTFEEKETALATWIDGSEKIMIATSALGTGVDIGGIRTVVHLGRPHGIIDFVQEVGRAGRGGEPVQSSILLGKGESLWLRSEAAYETEWNREGLRLFLNEQHCRRARLSTIMDGEQIVCGEAGGRDCDLCRAASGRVDCTRKKNPSTHRAEEQERRYAVGPRLWQDRVQKQAVERQTIERAVAAIGTQCAACWVQSKADSSHRPESCPVLNAVVGQEYWTKRRLLRFERECHCCYHCSLPGDWCIWYSQSQKCTQTDIVTPIVLAGWGDKVTREWLESEVGSKSIDSLIKWIGEASWLGGTRASNSVRVAQRIIEEKVKREGSITLQKGE